MPRRNRNGDAEPNFPRRLQELVDEYGSRYALAKASGIAISTLQAYEAGSNPGLEALVSLARTGNVSFDWLLTGRGEKRPVGILPGALLADVVLIDQYQPGSSMTIPMIIGQVPFSRRLLENKLGLQEPTQKTLLAIEARQNLGGIERGDLVLVDRLQTGLSEDGVYLFHLPGLALKQISVCPNDWVLMFGTETELKVKESVKPVRRSLKMRRSELLGDGRYRTSKVVGRAVSVYRTI
jgi:transcriptional regulator with XRE-family HTH domain